MADLQVRKLGLTQHTFGADSTDDISETFTVSECICDGIFFQKPATTTLTITITNPSVDSGFSAGSSVVLVLSEPADAETSGFRSSKIPIFENATITASTSGAVNGTKRIDFAFRLVRQGA